MSQGKQPEPPSPFEARRCPGKAADWRESIWLRPNPDHTNYHDRIPYALTIDIYDYARDVWEEDAIHGESRHRIEAIEPSTIHAYSFPELRARLCLVQRAIKWSGEMGYCDDLEEKFAITYDAICEAWDREWMQHVAEVEAAVTWVNSSSH